MIFTTIHRQAFARGAANELIQQSAGVSIVPLIPEGLKRTTFVGGVVMSGLVEAGWDGLWIIPGEAKTACELRLFDVAEACGDVLTQSTRTLGSNTPNRTMSSVLCLNIASSLSSSLCWLSARSSHPIYQISQVRPRSSSIFHFPKMLTVWVTSIPTTVREMIRLLWKQKITRLLVSLPSTSACTRSSQSIDDTRQSFTSYEFARCFPSEC